MPNQQENELLAAIDDHMRSTGEFPTLRELRDAVGAPSALRVKTFLRSIADKGIDPTGDLERVARWMSRHDESDWDDIQAILGHLPLWVVEKARRMRRRAPVAEIEIAGLLTSIGHEGSIEVLELREDQQAEELELHVAAEGWELTVVIYDDSVEAVLSAHAPDGRHSSWRAGLTNPITIAYELDAPAAERACTLLLELAGAKWRDGADPEVALWVDGVRPAVAPMGG